MLPPRNFFLAEQSKSKLYLRQASKGKTEPNFNVPVSLPLESHITEESSSPDSSELTDEFYTQRESPALQQTAVKTYNCTTTTSTLSFDPAKQLNTKKDTNEVNSNNNIKKIKAMREPSESKGKIRNKLGQFKERVGLDDYNQRIIRIIKDKYPGDLEKVDHVDLCNPHVTLLDLREEKHYKQGHLRSAINVPASQLIRGEEDNEESTKSTKHAGKLLLRVHIDSLLRYSVSQKKTHVFIFYYYTKHRMYSFFEFRRMKKLLRRAIKSIESALYPNLKDNIRSNFHVCGAERGFDHLVGDHSEFLSVSDSRDDNEDFELSQDDDTYQSKEIVAIIPNFIYYGDAAVFMQQIKLKDPPDDMTDRNLFFSDPLVPSWLKSRIVVNASSSRMKFTKTQNFEYIHINSADPENVFFDVIERAHSIGVPILVHECPLGCSLLATYLVGARRWSVATSLLHIIRSIQPKIAQFDVPTICNVLIQEKNFLSFSPSIKLQSLILQLSGDEDFSISTAFYESGNQELLQYREKRSKLFENLKTGKRTKSILLIDQSPDLIFSRDGPQDNTPLYVMIRQQFNMKEKTTIRLLTMLAANDCINLANIDGFTPLHIAASLAAENTIRTLLDLGASINLLSFSTQTLPLHEAAKSNCSASILELLVNPTIINAQDSCGSTALHLTSNHGNKAAMNILLSHGAEIKSNLLGQTPMHFAKNDPKLLQLLMEDARPGETSFAPFSSFAPFRIGNRGKFFVDGEETFTAMVNAIQNATQSIYITGWWLTPDYYLIRSGSPEEKIAARFDKLLLNRAENNVTIYIIIWDNVDSVVPIKSSFTKKYLDCLHPNIQIERHASSVQQFLAWSHHQKTVVVDERVAFVGGLDICLHRWDNHSHSVTDPSHVGALFPGRDYYNPRIISENDDKNDESFMEYRALDRSIHPRMPWHDVSCMIEGDSATDVALNFIQRWNHLLPKRVLSIPSRPEAKEFCSPCKGPYCQVVRSIGGWSLNSNIETSIYESYLHCIAKAKRFIYIENQFFISPPDSKMKIAQALIDRITIAFTKKLPFHVVIVLPIHPEGDFIGDVSLQRIYSWQQKTILYIDEQLRKLTRGTFSSPADFISFYALRNWGELNGKIVTEMIYVHTKLMITDKHIICGSANINERSMFGDRDSEIAVVFKDAERAASLRKKLWAEHLGLHESELSDDFMDDLKLWKNVADANTATFVNLFEDSIEESEPLTIKQFSQAFVDIRQSNVLKACEVKQMLLDKIRGHLVRFPVRFLFNELQSTVDVKQAAFQHIKELGGFLIDDLFR